MMRADYSNMYNYTIATNKDIEIFFDSKLVFSKRAEVKDKHSF